MKICMGNSFQNRLAISCLPDVRVNHRKWQFKHTSKPVGANRMANVSQLCALSIYFIEIVCIVMSVFVLFSITPVLSEFCILQLPSEQQSNL